MEDAHIASLEFDSGKTLFGVFDGHGGREVAHYAKKYLESCIRDEQEYKDKDYKEAMRKGFLKIDYKLEKEGGLDEVAEMKRTNPPNKSPLMKILTDSLGNGTEKKESPGGEDSLMLDSIGCTSVVTLYDFD